MPVVTWKIYAGNLKFGLIQKDRFYLLSHSSDYYL